MDFNEAEKVRLLWGNNCVLSNAKLFSKLGKRALIVTSKSAAKKSGAYLDVFTALERNSIKFETFDGVPENPSVAIAVAIAGKARAINADFLVGVGGGSVLDATRAAAVFAKTDFLRPTDIFKAAFTNVLPFVCVGTSAGTGSEVDSIAVLTDEHGCKKSVKSGLLYSWFSFCDPKYTYTLNHRQSISMALDALCHCLESWFSRAATPESDDYSRRGVSLIYPALVNVANDKYSLYNKKTREELYSGSLYGGLAIDITGTGFPHPCGYVLTELCGLPHGIASAMFENLFIRQSINERPEEREKLFEIVGTERALCDLFSSLTKNNLRLSRPVCDQIGERLKESANTEKTLGEFSWERGKIMVESRFLDQRMLDGFSGRWTL